jgi:hypothetical protein
MLVANALCWFCCVTAHIIKSITPRLLVATDFTHLTNIDQGILTDLCHPILVFMLVIQSVHAYFEIDLTEDSVGSSSSRCLHKS